MGNRTACCLAFSKELVTCDKANIASQRIIKKSGILHRELRVRGYLFSNSGLRVIVLYVGQSAISCLIGFTGYLERIIARARQERGNRQCSTRYRFFYRLWRIRMCARKNRRTTRTHRCATFFQGGFQKDTSFLVQSALIGVLISLCFLGPVFFFRVHLSYKESLSKKSAR